MPITRTAPAPQRATTSITLSAGMLAIPLAVYTGTETTAVTRREFLDGNPDIPVGRVSVRRDTNEPVDVAAVTRMAQADDGTWVVLDDHEIATATAGLSGDCDVVGFIPVTDAGQYLTDGLYQVRPKNGKRGNAAATAAFGLLLAGMNERKVHALVHVTMRGVPRYALLTTDGDLLPIVTADGIRQARDLPDTQPTKAEVDMACALIDAIGIDTPVVVDDSAPKVRAYVNDKAATGGVNQTGVSPAATPTVVDLAALLAASIDAAKAKKADTLVVTKPARRTRKAVAA